MRECQVVGSCLPGQWFIGYHQRRSIRNLQPDFLPGREQYDIVQQRRGLVGVRDRGCVGNQHERQRLNVCRRFQGHDI